jgi:hypothetical protein
LWWRSGGFKQWSDAGWLQSSWVLCGITGSAVFAAPPPQRQRPRQKSKHRTASSSRTTTTTHQQQQQQSIGSISITILTHALLHPKHDEMNTEKWFISYIIRGLSFCDM